MMWEQLGRGDCRNCVALTGCDRLGFARADLVGCSCQFVGGIAGSRDVGSGSLRVGTWEHVG